MVPGPGRQQGGALAASGLKPVRFATQKAFRDWLAKNHDRETALLVLLHKVHVADRGLTYAQALDEALCFGWIDGVRYSRDADTFAIRFSPRKPRSIWSAVNIRHMARLRAEGRLQPAGEAAFARRDEARSRVYSFENREKAVLTPAQQRLFKKNRAAWAFYQDTPPWYRRNTAHWVISAKRDETRARRLEKLIADCARGESIDPLLKLPKTRRGR